jgi:hypothetical protein
VLLEVGDPAVTLVEVGACSALGRGLSLYSVGLQAAPMCFQGDMIRVLRFRVQKL